MIFDTNEVPGILKALHEWSQAVSDPIPRMITISDCEDCSFKWMYLGTTTCCSLMGRRTCFADHEDLKYNENQPSWCPLPQATPELIARINIIANRDINNE